MPLRCRTPRKLVQAFDEDMDQLLHIAAKAV